MNSATRHELIGKMWEVLAEDAAAVEIQAELNPFSYAKRNLAQRYNIIRALEISPLTDEQIAIMLTDPRAALREITERAGFLVEKEMPRCVEGAVKEMEGNALLQPAIRQGKHHSPVR